jgi:hypothetical protein
MKADDVDWAIDTLQRTEDILGELKQQASRDRDYPSSQLMRTLCRELFGVRQLLEQERYLLLRLGLEPQRNRRKGDTQT